MKSTFILSAFATTSVLAGSSGDFLAPISDPHSGHNHTRPDSHAPIGVMGDHTHKAGEWMGSYRYMFMSMEQNYDGSNTVSDASVLANYIVSPTDMDMQMHMFGLMYAPTDRLTLMGMLNVVDVSMNHVIGRGPLAGQSFQTEAAGIGDSSVGGLFQLFATDNQRMHVGLMALLPTAEIDAEDFLPPMGRDGRLPYPMQLGAGSWGISPSLTWSGNSESWSWGGQVSGKIYLADNSEDYRLGNRVEGTVWGAHRWSDNFSTSLRLNVSHWGDIEGADPAIAQRNMMGVPIVPTADPNRRGGTRVDLSVGANVQIPNSNAHLAFEFGVPVYQDLDGPQLGAEWFTTVGMRYAF